MAASMGISPNQAGIGHAEAAQLLVAVHGLPGSDNRSPVHHWFCNHEAPPAGTWAPTRCQSRNNDVSVPAAHLLAFCKSFLEVHLTSKRTIATCQFRLQHKASSASIEASTAALWNIKGEAVLLRRTPSLDNKLRRHSSGVIYDEMEVKEEVNQV